MTRAGDPYPPIIPVRGKGLIPSEDNLSNILDATFGSTPGMGLVRGANGWELGTVGGAGISSFTGDGTVLSNTPSTSGVATLADAPELTLLSNITDESEVPAYNTLTSLIDAAIGSTQGSFLTRSVSVWELAPDFGYDITNNVPVWTPVAAPATTINRIWVPSGEPTFSIGRASGRARLGGCIFSCGQCASVNNTTAATSLFGSPTGVPSGMSLTFPANTLAAGNILRWLISGIWGCTGSGVTFNFEVLLNGSPILVPSNGVSITTTAAVTSLLFMAVSPPWYQILSTGSGATGTGANPFNLFNPTGSSLAQSLFPSGSNLPTSTFASNSNALFDIKVTIGTASAENFVQINSFQLFIDN
jgi:hypothetical protein